jgi:pimeloyl-ACP methyl ester carboxylesterase
MNPSVGLLDTLLIDRAHIVGISMGGQIAQIIATEFPARVRSLTSIMSWTGARDVGQPGPEVMNLFRLPPAHTREQAMAAIVSGDPTRRLATVQAPTLVIHGLDDRMVDPSGGRATAAAIPGAELVMIEGLGHN